MIRKKDEKSRCYMKQGVCTAKHIAAASWVDGSIVNVISNADASNISTVYRRIKDKEVAFTSPTCIAEYNSAMQGGDRHDQLRSRFSLADGHSFQKWHKKLAMVMIDIAKCNAYICDGIARNRRDGDDRNNTSRPRSRDINVNSSVEFGCGCDACGLVTDRRGKRVLDGASGEKPVETEMHSVQFRMQKGYSKDRLLRNYTIATSNRPKYNTK
ncbi:unnamed protein product [Phytophthora fragariaefolia]|uniref:Unnamed protein product n=1 Tax=Phytophthora fragariaefolia TaxID=1490495 RepID=A0A9W6Y9E8_9STRA|nr:unnamed protein product [Phytophthora fragariaefolia]